MADITVIERTLVKVLRWIVSLFLLSLLPCSTMASNPTHRYSFITNADDSIGGAHGILIGNAMITNGSLILNGTNGYVQMPANLFTNSDSLTLEIWFVNSGGGFPATIWTFQGWPIMSLLPDLSIGSYGGNNVIFAPLSLGQTLHLVWSQDAASHTARVFLNGPLFAQNTNFTASPVPTTSSSSFLGTRSVNLPPMNGSIFEFRIYSNALSHLEVLRSEALGPDALPADGDVLTGLYLGAPSHVGLNSAVRPLVFADFSNQEDVNITPLSDIVFTTSDTNVINPDTSGYLRAAGLGTAEVVATYGGLSSTSTVTVVAASQFALVHRYDFQGIPGRLTVPDLAGGADGTLFGDGVFTNGSQVFLDGRYDYMDLPDGILSSLSEVTVEAWVTGISINGKWWPRVFDFGSGGSYFFLAPSVAVDNLSPDSQLIRFAVSTNGIFAESPRLTAQPWMLDNFETHFAVTYSSAHNSSRLYVNGVLADSGTAPYPLSIIVDTNNWLGRSQFPADDGFEGLFNEFRIYRSLLDASDIAASYALGPDVIGADYVLHGSVADTNLTLAWGPSASWCVLKTSPSVAPGAIWTNAAVTTVFTNGRIEASIPLATDTRFFRLSPPDE